MITVKDISWLAGLLEGEGWFRIYGNGHGSPEIGIQMIDKDVIDHVAKIWGTKVHGPRLRNDPNHHDIYDTSIYGTIAASWMMTIYSLLGVRRREKIKGILKTWLAQPVSGRAPRGIHRMAICHPDQRLIAKGLCNTCYRRQYRMGGPLRNRDTQPWVRKRSTKRDLL